MTRQRLFFVMAMVLELLLVVTTVLAQSGGGYDLSWNTVDGGGVTNSMGGSYTLSGTLGQADAGAMSGGSYTLAGGFWGGGATLFGVYLPLIAK